MRKDIRNNPWVLNEDALRSSWKPHDALRQTRTIGVVRMQLDAPDGYLAEFCFNNSPYGAHVFYDRTKDCWGWYLVQTRSGYREAIAAINLVNADAPRMFRDQGWAPGREQAMRAAAVAAWTLATVRLQLGTYLARSDALECAKQQLANVTAAAESFTDHLRWMRPLPRPRGAAAEDNPVHPLRGCN